MHSLAPGGAERLSVDLCNSLVSSGEDVTLLTTDDDSVADNAFYKGDLFEDVHYFNLGARSGHSPRALRGIYRSIRQLRPDVVHAHTDLVQLLLPSLFLRRPHYVHTLHNLAGIVLNNRALMPLSRSLYRKLVTPVTISPICSKSYRELYGMDNDVMIVNGRNRSELSPEADAVRNRLNAFKANGRLFVHVARFAPQKNQKVLFEAISFLEDARLVVIGGDYPEDIIRVQRQDRVMFTGPIRNVADYLACSDFFVLSSSYEGLPISLLEALSWGVIPVSTPAGGVVDVIDDGRNGFLAAGFDATALADAMRRAMDSDICPGVVGGDYESHYSIGVCARHYLGLFNHLVNPEV